MSEPKTKAHPLRVWCVANGWKLAELATYPGLDPDRPEGYSGATMTAWLSGRRTPPAAVIRSIAQLTGGAVGADAWAPPRTRKDWFEPVCCALLERGTELGVDVHQLHRAVTNGDPDRMHALIMAEDQSITLAELVAWCDQVAMSPAELLAGTLG